MYCIDELDKSFPVYAYNAKDNSSNFKGIHASPVGLLIHQTACMRGPLSFPGVRARPFTEYRH